jgi:trans-aconitate methyltransferase
MLQTTAHFDQMAAELMVPLGLRPFDTVLELGCGTGLFYNRLGFDKRSYIGVDFSPSLLSKLKQKCPEAHLFCENAVKYEPEEPVDLIFSNGMVQYSSPADLDEHLSRAARSLTRRGWIFHAGIPWDAKSWHFYRGLFAKEEKPPASLRAMAGHLAMRTGLRKSFGIWYSFETVRKIAAKHGLLTQFFGSLLYPYRFHVALWKHVDES